MSAAMSAFAAPKVKRRPSSARRVPCPAPSPAALGVLLALGILVFSTASASAQSFFDPTSTIQAQATHWESQAAAWGRGIYLSLLVFELIALAVTTLLFRENLGEFFASVGLKVFVGGVYFWFIMNAGIGGGWASQVIGSFQAVGSTFGTRDAAWLTTKGLIAAGDYFAAGPAAEVIAQITATPLATAAGTAAAATAAIGPTAAAAAALATPCVYAVAAPGGYGTMILNCPGHAIADPILASLPALEQSAYQTAYQATYQPYNQLHAFTLITQGMGLMLVMALAAIWLQIIIMTIESYIVMGAGVLFIGFAGSRFTMPFSQGYFSYMFNVGVKFMVLYIVLGIEGTLMNTILDNSIATLVTAVAGAAIPYGSYASLALAALGVVNTIIAAALVWMLPGLAGSFLTGQSSASGSAVLGQAMGQMASASSMMANLNQAKRSDAAAKRQGNAPQSHSPKQDTESSAMGQRDNSQTSATLSNFTGQPANSQAGALSSGLASKPSQDPDESQLDRAADNRAMADTYRANAMSSLASGAPRDIGSPTAVQVRLSNPDKL